MAMYNTYYYYSQILIYRGIYFFLFYRSTLLWSIEHYFDLSITNPTSYTITVFQNVLILLY